MRLWNVETRSKDTLIAGHTEAVYTVRISSDNKWIVSGSGDKTVRLWNLEQISGGSI